MVASGAHRTARLSWSYAQAVPHASSTVRQLVRRRDFRRLLLTRLSAQFGDGVFQAALAGTVLFNPQNAADPLDVAAGFAVLLLPYSFVGPFAGVLLDRWSRRQVLVVANIVRAALVAVVAALVLAEVQGIGLYLGGLAVFSVNRFVLSALSAGLPHTTDTASLVSANALSTTSGGVVTVAGAGAAIGVLQLVDGGYAALALTAALPYLGSAAIAARFGRADLGPDRATDDGRASARDVVSGLVAGARHVVHHRTATVALGVLGVHRLLYGALTLMILLLYRNTFAEDDSWFPGGLLGLSQVLVGGAVGTFLAALVTPAVVRRIGKAWWTTLLLLLAGVSQLGLGLPFRPVLAVAAGLVLGLVSQGVKICVDTTLQETIEDDFRGRVFSFYDTLFNVTNVAALVIAAVLLPDSGRAPWLLVVVGLAYLLTALAYARLAGVWTGRNAALPHSAGHTTARSSPPTA